MRSFLKPAIVLILSSVFCPPSSDAQPLLINYQGRLIQGTNLVNGSVALSLRIFDAAAAGTLLYEDSNSVTVADGLYSTFLGDNTTAGSLTNALANTNAHIEVVVSGTNILSPRERIASVSYALRSDRATISTTVDDGAITSAKLAANSVSGEKIADGTVSNADLAAGSVNGSTAADGALTGSDVLDGSISNADVAANTFWNTTGNTGTIISNQFLGTLDYTSPKSA